jgi:hypothetical protein
MYMYALFPLAFEWHKNLVQENGGPGHPLTDFGLARTSSAVPTSKVANVCCRLPSFVRAVVRSTAIGGAFVAPVVSLLRVRTAGNDTDDTAGNDQTSAWLCVCYVGQWVDMPDDVPVAGGGTFPFRTRCRIC